MTTPSAQRQIDTRAIELAEAASGRLAGHEDLCAVRYQAILDGIAQSKADQEALRRELRDGFAQIYRILWTSALGIIAILLGWVAFLVAHDMVGAQ